jgi:hypothetical protein
MGELKEEISREQRPLCGFGVRAWFWTHSAAPGLRLSGQSKEAPLSSKKKGRPNYITTFQIRMSYEEV